MKEIKKIKELIEANDKIVLFHHIMPDGDSLSCSYALVMDLREKYPKKEVYWMPDMEYINKRFPYLSFDESTIIKEVDDSFLGIVGDTSVKSRIHNTEWFMKTGKKIVFDHHRNDIDIENYDVFWHEPEFTASAMQSWMIAEELGVKMNEERALMHWLGINTDTYRFAYSFADPLPLRMAADIFEYISDKRMQELYRAMDQKTMKSIKFQGWVYENFEQKGGVSYMKITKADLKKLNMESDEAARVNLIGNIEGIKVWMFFTEYPDFIRVEFRSHKLPVNELAKEFGGGGHLRASGARITDWKDADKIIDRAVELAKDY